MNNCMPYNWRSEDIIPMVPMSVIDGVLYDYTYPFELRYESLVCGNKSNVYQWGFSFWMMAFFAGLHGIHLLFPTSIGRMSSVD